MIQLHNANRTVHLQLFYHADIPRKHTSCELMIFVTGSELSHMGKDNFYALAKLRFWKHFVP